MLGQPAPEPPRAAVEQEEREPDDDRRQGERQVDERVDDPLPGKALAHDRERADHAEDGVRRHRDRRDLERQEKSVLRCRRRDRIPGGTDPVLEGAPEDEPDGRREHDQEVREPEKPQRPPRHGRASSSSAGVLRSRAARRT